MVATYLDTFAHGLLNGAMGQFKSTLYSPYHLFEQGELCEKEGLAGVLK
jgi:hypothetical protein